jgi:hypothetical protein
MLNVNIDGVDVGTTQLMSVPYALYAVSSGSSSGGGGGVGISSTVDNGDGTFTLNYTDGTSFTTTNLSGKSAYQLWIDQGNTGTEEDCWQNCPYNSRWYGGHHCVCRKV